MFVRGVTRGFGCGVAYWARSKVSMLWSSRRITQHGDKKFMFDFLFDFALAVFALAPFGVLVLLWIAFPEDHGVHPIYRESRIEIQVKNKPIPRS